MDLTDATDANFYCTFTLYTAKIPLTVPLHSTAKTISSVPLHFTAKTVQVKRAVDPKLICPLFFLSSFFFVLLIKSALEPPDCLLRYKVTKYAYPVLKAQFCIQTNTSTHPRV